MCGTTVATIKLMTRPYISKTVLTSSKRNRREVIEGLGLQIVLGKNGRGKYADMVFIASGISPIRGTLRIACPSALGIIHPALYSASG